MSALFKGRGVSQMLTFDDMRGVKVYDVSKEIAENPSFFPDGFSGNQSLVNRNPDGCYQKSWKKC